MPPRQPLPPQLSAAAFSIAAARELGLDRGRLRGPDLASPFRGVRASINPDAPAARRPRRPDPTASARAYAPLLRPGDRFSHTTAAALWGAPLPIDWPNPLHVTSDPRAGRARTSGVIGHISRTSSVSVRDGMPVSDPLALFIECAGIIDRDDLTAIGDYLVHEPRQLDPADLRPHLSIGELRAGLARASGRHVRAARTAADLVRPGVESPFETLLRLVVADAGLPEPECGYELRDERGRWIGWFDLAWPQWRVIAEYDGDQHRTSTRQYERDISRFDRADRAGWKVIRVRRRGILVDRAITSRRISEALTRAGCPL